jgi:hypothetical protein
MTTFRGKEVSVNSHNSPFVCCLTGMRVVIGA